ncbi:MAG: hypothetical protein JKY93_02295 [Gammaproteobacteria bacterium]|nr:hypothetical protein [Gammaproteobacteria bacterium]
MNKPSRLSNSKKTNTTTNDAKLLIELVRAMARQQARQDHEMAQTK